MLRLILAETYQTASDLRDLRLVTRRLVLPVVVLSLVRVVAPVLPSFVSAAAGVEPRRTEVLDEYFIPRNILCQG